MGHADCMRWCNNGRLYSAEVVEVLVGQADCMRWCNSGRLHSAEVVVSVGGVC